MADRARYDWLTSEIRRLRADCETHSYDIGLFLDEVSDGALFRLDGYASLNEYIDLAVSLERAQAYKALRVARNYTRETAARLGISKCDLWLTYIRISPEDDVAADLLRATILVDGVRVPVVEATKAQLEAAIARLRASGSPGLPPEAAKLHETLASALAPFAGAQAKVSADLTVGFSGFAGASLCDIIAALQRGLACPIDRAS